jgi:hypothetical protein
LRANLFKALGHRTKSHALILMQIPCQQQSPTPAKPVAKTAAKAISKAPAKKTMAKMVVQSKPKTPAKKTTKRA